MRRGLLAIPCLAVSTAGLQAQITNGNFNINSCPPPNSQGYADLARGNNCISGWTIGDGTTDSGLGTIDLVTGGVILGGTWQPPAGASLSIDLDGFTAGSISQTFTTIPGATYIVGFALSGNPAGGSSIKTLLVTGPGPLVNTSAVYTYNTSIGNADVPFKSIAFWKFPNAVGSDT